MTAYTDAGRVVWTVPCGECGMPCTLDEYHPYAACLMFKASRNSEVVRSNLQAILNSQGGASLKDAGRVVAWQYAGLYPQSVPPFRRDRADGYTIALVPESLLAEAERERDAFKVHCDLLTHKVITCGVAARHPDASLAARGAYAGKWDSPQAQDVRKLRAERDALQAQVDAVRALADEWAERSLEVDSFADSPEDRMVSVCLNKAATEIRAALGGA